MSSNKLQPKKTERQKEGLVSATGWLGGIYITDNEEMEAKYWPRLFNS